MLRQRVLSTLFTVTPVSTLDQLTGIQSLLKDQKSLATPLISKGIP